MPFHLTWNERRPHGRRAASPPKTGDSPHLDLLPSIYLFEDFSAYFDAYMRSRRALDQTYSYRRLCRAVNLKSPSLLAMIAGGQRAPGPGLLLKICKAFELSNNEVAYAEALVSKQRVKDASAQQSFDKRLEELRPRETTMLVDLEVLRCVSRWYHLALLEMVDLRTFRDDADWIAARLGDEIPAVQVQDALRRMIALGLLARTDDGRLLRVHRHLETPTDLPSATIRRIHREMLARASKALDQRHFVDRFFRSQTFNVERSKLPEAEQLTAEYLEKLTKLCQPGMGDETYHCAVQCFRLTHPLPPGQPKI